MHRALVKSAAAANMNLLRIWGGGVYIYEEFTDACDEEGVMVYEDMMYGTDGIMPGEQWMLSHSSIRAMRAVSLLADVCAAPQLGVCGGGCQALPPLPIKRRSCATRSDGKRTTPRSSAGVGATNVEVTVHTLTLS